MATAKPGFASQQEVYNALVRNGASPQDAQILAAITRPESSGYTAATNHYQGHTYMGLFQIGEFWGVDPNRIRSDDIDYQAQQAIRVLHTQGLNAWQTYSNGSYKQYLGQNDASSGASSSDLGQAVAQAQALQSQRDPSYNPATSNGSHDPFQNGGQPPTAIDSPGGGFGNPVAGPPGFDQGVNMGLARGVSASAPAPVAATTDASVSGGAPSGGTPGGSAGPGNYQGAAPMVANDGTILPPLADVPAPIVAPPEGVQALPAYYTEGVSPYIPGHGPTLVNPGAWPLWAGY